MAEITPRIEHWIIPIARTAGLDRVEELQIPSNADASTAWARVMLRSGIDAEELADLVARHFRLDRAEISEADPGAARLLPAHVARHQGVLPLSCTDREIVIATANPVAFDAERVVGLLTARAVHVEIAPPDRIAEALDRTYGTAPHPNRGRPLRLGAPDTSPHILVVEDDADARLLIRTLLERENFRVTEARSGPAALEKLARSSGIDLITLDLKMEGMSGLDVLKRIRKDAATSLLPVVVATGVDDPEVEMELFTAGADDFVVKPVDPPRFLLRVRAVLRRYQPTGSLL